MLHIHLTIQSKFKHASFLFFDDAVAIFILIKKITNHYEFTVLECDCKNKLLCSSINHEAITIVTFFYHFYLFSLTNKSYFSYLIYSSNQNTLSNTYKST